MSSIFCILVIEDNYVIYRDFVDISVAVATPKVSDFFKLYKISASHLNYNLNSKFYLHFLYFFRFSSFYKCFFFFYKGLVVPVLRDVNKMNFADIEREMNALGEKVF